MPNTTDFPPLISHIAVTIADAGTESDAIDLCGNALVGIYTASTFDGTTITLKACDTVGGTFLPINNGAGSSSAYTITTAASKFAPIDNLAITAGARFVKLVVTSQTGATVVTLAVRPL